MSDLIIRGPKRTIETPSKGFGQYIFERADELGDKICQIDGNTDEIETYAQVKSRSTKVALGKQQLGFKPKEIAFLCCKSGINNITLVLATLYLGGYVSSANPKQSTSEIRYLMSLVKPKMNFVDQESVELIHHSLVGLDLTPCIIVIGNSDKYTLKSLEKIYDEEKFFRPVPQKLADIAFIMFSSGTTSSPKGIYVTNKYLLDRGMMTLENADTSKPGVIMHFTSFYWISAWFMTSAAIATGSAKVVGSGISAEKCLYLVEKYKVTFISMSNSYTYEITSLSKELIEKYDTSSLLSIAVVGSPAHPAQISKLRQLLPYTHVCMGYGSTETNSITYFDYTDQEAYKNKIQSSGTLRPGVELKIIDLTTGHLLGHNQEGEIRIRSPSSMSGYHNLDTNAAFDEDGFLKIGDLGYYDQDHYVYVTGRVNDTFKYQTNQIIPSVIENVIVPHPAVVETVAFGVKHLVDNNHPGALVVLQPMSEVDAKELMVYTNERVSNSHRLRAGILVVNDIPKTPTGKIQRRTIKEMLNKMFSLQNFNTAFHSVNCKS
ncbi:4-coumarate--CoA ligase-like [Sitophilus oryzae]|uniref:4-coumarate--CoA ligase-like n=1 Tax=Sitophilus oryzae TaxID=7048 RepID=A0A6J2YVG3_SITOR|nr:4-coumarate--CoA ligase-like [Sitophilus oryzae]